MTDSSQADKSNNFSDLPKVATQRKQGKSLGQVGVVFTITCMPGIPVSPFSPLIPGGPLD